MASISSIEKDSIATTQDSFKDCILACKISNQMHTNFEKRKFAQTDNDNFVVLSDICSVQYLFFHLWQKFLQNMFEIVRT